MSILQKDSKGQILYAVAYELYDEKKNIVKCGMEYMHAENAGHAKGCFFLGNPDAIKLQMQNRIKVVDAAPVVGFHVLDDNGDNLET